MIGTAAASLIILVRTDNHWFCWGPDNLEIENEQINESFNNLYLTFISHS